MGFSLAFKELSVYFVPFILIIAILLQGKCILDEVMSVYFIYQTVQKCWKNEGLRLYAEVVRKL
jgi:hypothetical protein